MVILIKLSVVMFSLYDYSFNFFALKTVKLMVRLVLLQKRFKIGVNMLYIKKIIYLFLIVLFIPHLYPIDLDNQEIIDFFNDQIPQIMEENSLAGIVISIVNKDKIIFSKGYGYADIEYQIKVDPDKTLFRAGSISKLFTWTAIMQLKEQGGISLDENVNTYLGEIKIPDTFVDPIL